MTDIIACDPGGVTTGIVWIRYSHDRPAIVMESWSLEGGIVPFLNWWNNEFSALPPIDVVVCEQFVNRNIAGADLSPLRLQGAIEVLAMQRGIGVELQPAAGGHTAVTDAAMARIGITKKTFVGDNHNDRFAAARHGLWFLKRHKHMPTLNAMYPR